MVELEKKPPRSKASKSLRQDDSIMGTNSSSITSKRSVERLYFPNECHYFRHFVKKPQRRAPLINRGYWLRMKAIDFVVHQFLEEVSEKPKIIVNLGCGYDPLPWQCLGRYPDLCKGVKFVDVDYADLMLKKRDVVTNTAELMSMLTNMSSGDSPLLVSDEYIQIACDLRDLTSLNTALSSVFGFEDSLVLFSAEVSITYMTATAADALITWAGTLPNVRFCLLEQILPQGPYHPFAKTMLGHFNKLSTPLGSVHKYPTISDQEQRFSAASWKSVKAISLWELWASSTLGFLTPKERQDLDHIEPFDEWEEFALFCGHYFLLFAENGTTSCSSLLSSTRDDHQSRQSSTGSSAKLVFTEYPKNQGRRRFAAPLVLRSSKRDQNLIGSFAGMGLNSRLNSLVVYSPSNGSPDLRVHRLHQSSSSEGPSKRMCHTVTDMGDVSLLIGGRSSPDQALADCWLYYKWNNIWERVEDLPIARYRHSAVFIGNGKVMIIGGKQSSADIVNEILVWDRYQGWETIRQIPVERVVHPCPRFGAILSMGTQSQSKTSGKIIGLLGGGMSEDGVILRDIWQWTLDEMAGKLLITFRLITSSQDDQSVENITGGFARFGASVVNHLGNLLVIGGVGRTLLSGSEEITSLYIPSNHTGVEELSTQPLQVQTCDPRPLLIGVSVSSLGGSIIITGGGAVCFSFGTCWNQGCYTIVLESLSEHNHRSDGDGLPRGFQTWRYLETTETTLPRTSLSSTHDLLPTSSSDQVKIVDIQRVKITSREEFDVIVSASQPVILYGSHGHLGRCTETWSSESLKERVGVTKEVVVHKATQEPMNFVSKNFEYIPMKFGDFMDSIDAGEALYLRSLSEKPSELPADLRRDFPVIAADFTLPKELALVEDSAHSSPLRISGDKVSMWLHYDVMANVLCQIRGTKRVLLFPPSDVQFLNFSPGASSSSLDIFQKLQESKLGLTSPHEAIINPGDILFIPPLWLHAVAPTEGVSIAVNIFFKNLNHGYAPGRDIYANRDLQAYEKGRQDVMRIIKSLDNLPQEIRRFYTIRLADELRSSTEVKSWSNRS